MDNKIINEQPELNVAPEETRKVYSLNMVQLLKMVRKLYFL